MRLFDATCLGALLLVASAPYGSNHDAPFATRVVSMPYPRLAALARITGTVLLRVRIDGTGKVLLARGLSGHPILVKAAARNIKFWKFSAGRLAGETAESEFDFTYVFELSGTSDAQLPCSRLIYEYPNKATIVSEAPLPMP